MEEEKKEEVKQPEAEVSKITKKEMSVKQMFGLGILVVLILLVIGSWGGTVYAVRHLSKNPYALKMAKVFNVSAAEINGQDISYVDYIRDTETLKKLYGQQGAPIDDTQVSNQAMTRLVGNKLIASLAKKYDISLTDEDISKVKADLLTRFNGDEQALRTELKNNYGWEYEDYIELIVKPAVLEQKLSEKFMSNTDEENKKYESLDQVKASHILFQITDPASVDTTDPNAKTLTASITKENTAAKANAQKVLKRVLSGEDFATLAKEFSNDPGSKENGGSLGWFSKGQMVPEFEEAAFALAPGKVTGKLVQTQFGYHIIKVEEKRLARDFSAFMTDQLKAADFKLFIKIANPFESLLNPAGVATDTAVVTDTTEVVQ